MLITVVTVNVFVVGGGGGGVGGGGGRLHASCVAGGHQFGCMLASIATISRGHGNPHQTYQYQPDFVAAS